MISTSELIRIGVEEEEAFEDEDASEDLDRSLASDKIAWSTCRSRETPRWSTFTDFLKKKTINYFFLKKKFCFLFSLPRFRSQSRDQE